MEQFAAKEKQQQRAVFSAAWPFFSLSIKMFFCRTDSHKHDEVVLRFSYICLCVNSSFKQTFSRQKKTKKEVQKIRQEREKRLLYKKPEIVLFQTCTSDMDSTLNSAISRHTTRHSCSSRARAPNAADRVTIFTMFVVLC